MEIPLTPLELARRTRALYADREAVVDGALRLTYAQFFARCDRWSNALIELGVQAGDRVAYIAPNTHAELESFYAVPQIGAVLVPINYRLSPDEFAYIIGHSGASVVCAHEDYLPGVDRIRSQIPGVRHFVALEGRRDGWLHYETLLDSASPSPVAVPAIDERDLLTINYTSGTTSRPKGVMITHRNAYMNIVGTLLHLPMQRPIATCGRCRCSTPTAGRSYGRSLRSGARTSACGRSIRSRCSNWPRPSASRCSARRRRC
jgi:fatty-acyl-CoA synthase